MKPTVTVDSALDRLVNRLKSSSQHIAKVITTENNEIAQQAKKRWPVGTYNAKTGPTVGKELAAKLGFKPSRRSRPHSRDMIKTDDGIAGDSIVAFVVIDVAYAFYIKTKQNGLGGKSPWQELLRKPGIAAGKRLGVVLAKDLADIAGGGRG